jgi:hypothetical protein
MANTHSENDDGDGDDDDDDYDFYFKSFTLIMTYLNVTLER